MKPRFLAALAAFIVSIATFTASACDRPTHRCYRPNGEPQPTSQAAPTVNPAAFAVAMASWAMPFCYKQAVAPAEVTRFDEILRQNLVGLHPLAPDESPGQPAPNHPEQAGTMVSYTGNPAVVTAVYRFLEAKQSDYCVLGLTAWMTPDAKQVTAFTIAFDGEP